MTDSMVGTGVEVHVVGMNGIVVSNQWLGGVVVEDHGHKIVARRINGADWPGGNKLLVLHKDHRGETWR